MSLYTFRPFTQARQRGQKLGKGVSQQILTESSEINSL